MKNNGHMRRKKRNIIMIIALAVSCILCSELIACRICAPELYRKITSPVQQGWNSICKAGENLIGLLLAHEQDSDQSSPNGEHSIGLAPQIAGLPLLESTLPSADPAVTALKTVDGRQVLTGNGQNTVYFNQGDEAWSALPYGKDNIGGYGCGPTAMAMVVSTMTDVETDPELMAQWAVQHHYWASKSGSYLSIVEGTASAFGLTAEPLAQRTPEALENAILSGNLLVALMGPGHFTDGGHFIVLRGVTLTGEILVADPNSLDRSLIAWDPQLILDELSSSTASGAPLWKISPAA